MEIHGLLCSMPNTGNYATCLCCYSKAVDNSKSENVDVRLAVLPVGPVHRKIIGTMAQRYILSILLKHEV